MYLTAFLAEELSRIALEEHLAAANRARLVRLATCADEERSCPSLVDRLVGAVRPTPATCAGAC